MARPEVLAKQFNFFTQHAHFRNAVQPQQLLHPLHVSVRSGSRMPERSLRRLGQASRLRHAAPARTMRPVPKSASVAGSGTEAARDATSSWKPAQSISGFGPGLFGPICQVPVILPVGLVTPVTSPVVTLLGSKLLGAPLAESNEELPTVNTSSRKPGHPSKSSLKANSNNVKAEARSRPLIVKLELKNEKK